MIFVPYCLVLEFLLQNLILHYYVLSLYTTFIIRNILYQITQHYFIFAEIVVTLASCDQIFTFCYQLSENHLQEVVEFIYLQVHVFG